MKRRLFRRSFPLKEVSLIRLVGLVLICLSLQANAADFSVVTTNDAGAGSLREALLAANQNPGRDRILFDIPGDGRKVIRIETQLPAIEEPLEIDGFSQRGSRPNEAMTFDDAVRTIELDGINQTLEGLVLSAGNCEIRGLRLRRFATAISIQSSSNVISGCFLGYEQPVPGSVDNLLGNATGIRIGGLCCVGFDVCCNRVGGGTLADRNVIAGNSASPIRLGDLGAAIVYDTWILGNFFGVDASGKTHALAYGWSAITVRSASGVQIGSGTESERNVIAVARAANPGGVTLASAGVRIYSASSGVRIRGNYIGVGADGTTPLLEALQQDIGVLIQPPDEGAPAFKDCVVEGNVMASMCEGIWIREFRSSDGSIVAGSGVTIRSNLISSVVFSPIVLGSLVQTNDPGDIDEGANGRQNHPEIGEAVATNGVTLINGLLRSTPSSSYDLEFFGSASTATNGLGMLERYVGRIAVVTDSNGVAAFSFGAPAWSAPIRYYSATATDAAGNTSMISPATHVRTIVPVVFEHPTNRTVLPGANVTFGAVVSGATPVSLQWRLDGQSIPGATNLSLTLTNVQLDRAGGYDLVLSNGFGSVTSRIARLVVSIRPLIVQQPLSQTVVSNQSVTLSVGVTNTASLPLLYVWRSNALTVAVEVSERRVSFFKTPALQRDASYVVVVSNALTAAVLSSRANLTVLPDGDGDGLPDDYESVYGLNPTDAADALGDIDGDGFSNADEFAAGTDPKDSANQLRIQRITSDTDGTLIEFHALSNKTYVVEYRDALAGAAWLEFLRLPARATNRVETVVDREPNPSRYYRLSTAGF